jgi:hypothetical protein
MSYWSSKKGWRLYADADEVSATVQRHAMILRQALSQEESARFIAKLA